MKIIYESDDGSQFSSEENCLAYEKRNKLPEFVAANIGLEYNQDAGFSIIEVHNVVDFVRNNIDQLFLLVNAE